MLSSSEFPVAPLSPRSEPPDHSLGGGGGVGKSGSHASGSSAGGGGSGGGAGSGFFGKRVSGVNVSLSGVPELARKAAGGGDANWPAAGPATTVAASATSKARPSIVREPPP